MKIAVAIAIASSLAIACGASEGPKDPAPVITPPEESVKSACIQRIYCLDGSEYCCKTNACTVAKCEPPQWDRVSCTCK
jgi:hypothetical protein